MDKVAFVDLQNTITGSFDKFDIDTIRKIKKAEYNYKICVVTTSFESDLRYFLQLNDLNWDYICNSGTLMKTKGFTFTNHFNLNVEDLLKYDKDITFLFYEIDDVLTIYNYLPFLESIYPKNNNRNLIKNIREITDKKFSQMILCFNNDAFNQFHEEFKDKLHFHIIGQDMKKTIFRLTKKGTNKGSFIERYLQINDIKLTNTISFGDSLEDFRLFNQTNVHVAVANAEKELKSEADFIVQPFYDNGVWDFLILFDDPSTLK